MGAAREIKRDCGKGVGMVVGNRRAVYVYLPVGEVRDGSLQSCTTGTVCSEGKAGTTLFDLSDIRVTGDHSDRTG